MRSGAVGCICLILWHKNHAGLGVVVHQTGIATPGNHGLEGLLGVVIRQGAANILDDTLSFNFLVLMQQSNDDVEQAKLEHLFGKDGVAASRVGSNKAPSQFSKANLVFRSLDQFQNLCSLDQRDSLAKLPANLIRNIVDVGQLR